MKHDPKSVLVTGGAGFIGSNFLNWMVERFPDVFFLNLDALTYAGNLANLDSISGRNNYRFEKGSITDENLIAHLFEQYSFDTVVHFAAESHVDRSIEEPLSFVHSNVVGTAVLLDVAKTYWSQSSTMQSCRFHHVSTDEVFGSLGAEGLFSESSPYDPKSPYAASKASSDHFVRAFSETYGLPVIISNCSNNFGPFQFPEKLVPLTIVNAVNESPIPIYGKGDNVRDWLYVADHCEALDLILRFGSTGGTYLVGGKNEVANLHLVETIVDLVDVVLDRPPGTGRKLIRFVEDRLGHDFRYAVDTTRIESELGWKPAHTLENGLEHTVNWYLTNSEWLKGVQNETYRDYYNGMYGDRLDTDELA